MRHYDRLHSSSFSILSRNHGLDYTFYFSLGRSLHLINPFILTLRRPTTDDRRSTNEYHHHRQVQESSLLLNSYPFNYSALTAQ